MKTVFPNYETPNVTSSTQQQPDGPRLGVMGRVRETIPGLVVVGALAVLAFGVNQLVGSISPLVAGVALGALVANSGMIGLNIAPSTRCALAPGVTVAAKRLLRLGIVLLGFRLALSDLRDLGGVGIMLVALVVTCTFLGTQWIGNKLGLSKDLSLLVATGYSICGASAIAAMDGVVDADEEETAYAVALVTLCGTLAIVVLPLLAVPLGLEGAMFGSWVGASVHDVAQVIATAATDGDEASSAAIVVKLTRVVLLAPMVAMVALRRRRQAQSNEADIVESNATAKTKRPPILPLFVVLFLGAIVLRSTEILTADTLDGIKWAEKILLTLALVGLGFGVRFERLRKLGGRPLALGLISWILVSTISYIGVRLTS